VNGPGSCAPKRQPGRAWPVGGTGNSTVIWELDIQAEPSPVRPRIRKSETGWTELFASGALPGAFFVGSRDAGLSRVVPREWARLALSSLRDEGVFF
jgi:hypothetical protein